MTRTAIPTVLLLLACGGPAPPLATGGAPGDDASTWTDRAADAWSRLDPARAAETAEAAITLDGNPVAREIAARAHLALGHPDRAVQALAGIEGARLLRLRAQAQALIGDWDGALLSLDAAARQTPDEDPSAVELRGIAEDAQRATMYEIAGPAETSLAFEQGLPLPVVLVRADTWETLAMVATGAHYAIVDRDLRADPGVLDELYLGDLRVRGVPHTVRDLSDVRGALGEQVGMVIGLDLLLRLNATIDGPGGRLVLRQAASAPSPEQSAARFYTPSGTFLAVPTAIEGGDVWLTADTGGLYPVALTADTAERFDESDFQEMQPGVSMTRLALLPLGTLEVQEVPAIRGLLDASHAAAAGAPVAGGLGWLLFGQLKTTVDAERRLLRFE